MKVVGMQQNKRKFVRMMEYAKRMPLDPIKTPQNSSKTPDDVILLLQLGHHISWKPILLVL